MNSFNQKIQKWLLIAVVVVVAGVSVSAAMSKDEQIESTAKESIMFRNYLKDDSITVKSNQGFVTLTGTVSGPSHRSMAEDTLENVDGVKHVNNKLTIRGDSVDDNSDGWIGTKVKTTLLFHRNVNGMKTQVDVKAGVVTLKGEADTQAQKELTAEFAKDVDGVKSVTNDLTVVSSTGKSKETVGGKIDDASITSQVKFVLLYHRATSALKTKVRTRDGVVLLTGNAKNSAERDLVAKLVEDINGVKSVQNNMTISPTPKG